MGNRYGLIVTLPAYDEPDIFTTLESLAKAQKPGSDVEVIVHINCPAHASFAIKDRSLHQYNLLQEKAGGIWFTLTPLLNTEIPSKIAGAGHARKVAMDLAFEKFNRANNPDGIIVCLDADCEVSENYFTAIQDWFMRNERMDAASIHYEHPFDSSLEQDSPISGIIAYELHLRYYIQALQAIGHPHAFQTVGSAMAVRAGAYEAQGGMNQRKAGEDFYFLQKYAEIGKLGRLHGAVVYPSSRVSHRVPFGTGRAMDRIKGGDPWQTYAWEDILSLGSVFSQVNRLYTDGAEGILREADEKLVEFLFKTGFQEAVDEARKHTGSFESFEKRFFRWFNMFRVMKYLNVCKLSGPPAYPHLEYPKMLGWLQKKAPDGPALEMLRFARKLDLQLPECP